jgi:hypothetical protein
MIQQFPDCAEFPTNVFARFMMGFNHNIQEASAKFASFLIWVREGKVLMSKPEDFALHSTQPFRFIGVTRQGVPIILLQLKNLKIRLGSHADVGYYIGCVVADTLSKGNQILDNYYMIIDVKDYTKENLDVDGLKRLIPVITNYFPDVLFKMALINLGFLTSNLFSFIMMFMHETTRKKMKMAKENVEQIKTVLTKDIDLGQIPAAYGGHSQIVVE